MLLENDGQNIAANATVYVALRRVAQFVSNARDRYHIYKYKANLHPLRARINSTRQCHRAPSFKSSLCDIAETPVHQGARPFQRTSDPAFPPKTRRPNKAKSVYCDVLGTESVSPEVVCTHALLDDKCFLRSGPPLR